MRHEYRPDIDGLRAVAVLSVVLYHAWPNYLPGGFVGVDIFFVISGFLITSIIQEQIRQKTFTLGNFYARRIRRIFPALTVVLAAVLLAGWFVLLPAEFGAVGLHTAAGSAFVANFVLWSEVGYFDSDAILKPLLHLWSLGIEEQFYIVWPLAMLIFRARPMWLWAAIIVATVASLAASIAIVDLDQPAAFYSPLTRLWELAVGGIAARLAGSGFDAGRYANPLSALGLLLIGLALALVNEQRAFPGAWALLPIGGAFCLVMAGPGAAFNRFLLSPRPVVWVGLISYPLYLWHWPLLSFAAIVQGQKLHWTSKAALIAAAVLLSAATYRWIERPIRGSRGIKLSVIGLCSCMVVVGSAGLVVGTGLLKPRIDAGAAEVFLNAMHDRDYPGPLFEPLGYRGLTFQALKPALRPQGPAAGTTLFIGDSIVEHYGPRIEAMAESPAARIRNVVFATSAGCPPVNGLARLPLFQYPICVRRTAAAFELAHEAHVSDIVIGANWYAYFSARRNDLRFDPADGGPAFPSEQALDRAFGRLAADVRSLVEAGKTVHIVLVPPAGPGFDPRNMYTGSRLDSIRPVQPIEPFDLDEYEHAHGGVRQRLIDLAGQAGARIIDPAVTLCQGRRTCAVLDERGEPLYMDESHFRPRTARRLVTYLDETVLIEE